MPAWMCTGWSLSTSVNVIREYWAISERLGPRLVVDDLGNGERNVARADTLRRLPEVNEPVTITVRERPEERSAQQREHRRIRADAEGKRQNDSRGEAPGAAQAAEGSAEVGEEVHWGSVKG